jgi:hypothetical protein
MSRRPDLAKQPLNSSSSGYIQQVDDVAPVLAKLIAVEAMRCPLLAVSRAGVTHPSDEEPKLQEAKP